MLDRDQLRKSAAFILRWLLGGAFLWAGAVKLTDPKAFARALDAFGLVPEPLLPPVAVLLPLLELLVGLAVLRRWRGGLPAMAGLLLLFMAVLGYAIGQRLDVDCGCFSLAEQRQHTSVQAAFVRDLLMLAGVVALGLLGRWQSPLNQGALAPIQEREERS
jgi:uncharacterized membrane protein YphA (DoxX/SURF4 family)